jgi:hypothetical protein
MRNLLCIGYTCALLLGSMHAYPYLSAHASPSKKTPNKVKRCMKFKQAEAVATEKRSTTLERSELWEVNASAATCQENWEIKDVRWHCVQAESQ